MIKVIRGSQSATGVYDYTVASPRLFGRSRQPLLDACRRLKSLVDDPKQQIGLFREGMTEADISCRLEIGAETTVSEPRFGNAPRFRKYHKLEDTLRQNATVEGTS